MASSMDTISEAFNKIHGGMSKPYIIKLDQEDLVIEKMWNVLKAIPGLTKDTMIKEYDAFLVEIVRAKWYLIMTILKIMKYILLKYGSL